MTDTDIADAPQRPKAPVELRSAKVGDVNQSQRVVTVVVAPYEEPTSVMWRGEVWQESFERSAWDGIEKRPNRVRANRAHDRRMTCGRAINFFPSRQEGLVAEVRMAQTPLGDETMQLCIDECLDVSAGFAALPDDQVLNRSERTRKIRRAFLDHISFVEDPAYRGAKVLDVRENEIIIPDDETVMAGTPGLDTFMSDPEFVAMLKRSKS